MQSCSRFGHTLFLIPEGVCGAIPDIISRHTHKELLVRYQVLHLAVEQTWWYQVQYRFSPLRSAP